MLNFDDYKAIENEIDRPVCAKMPKIPAERDSELYRIHADQLDKYKEQKKIWDDYWNKINEKNNILRAKFYKDLLQDLGITDNPKAPKLYELAWQFGHSSGYCSVYEYAIELLPLIED